MSASVDWLTLLPVASWQLLFVQLRQAGSKQALSGRPAVHLHTAVLFINFWVRSLVPCLHSLLRAGLVCTSSYFAVYFVVGLNRTVD